MPTDANDRTIAEQIQTLAEGAFQHTEPVDLPLEARATRTDRAVVGLPHERKRPKAPIWMAAAAVLLVVAVALTAFWPSGRDATELQTASKPGPPATTATQPVQPEPEVITLPAAAAVPDPVAVDLSEVGLDHPDNVVLGLRTAWLATSTRGIVVSTDRGASWTTSIAPFNATPGCMNGDEEFVVGVSQFEDGQWLTKLWQGPADRPPKPELAVALQMAEGVPMAGTDSGELALFCRPAKVGDRWAVAASDGTSLTVLSVSSATNDLFLNVLTFPPEWRLEGGLSQTNLYASGDRFIAEICVVVQSLCSTTTLSFPATALESTLEHMHIVEPGQSPTSIAERYGISLRDLLAANPDSIGPDLAQNVEQWTIPGVGRIDPGTVSTSLGELGQLDDPRGQSHPLLFEGQGETWQVVALDVDGDPEQRYSGPGLYAVSRFGDGPVLLPDTEVWRVDVFPNAEGARVRVWTTSPSAENPEFEWYSWGDADDGWVPIADPVTPWLLVPESDSLVSFVEFGPDGLIRVLEEVESAE